MSFNVDQLLDSLREHGTIDVEERSFSISLSKARSSLAAFQTSNPRRFLVALVAGLNAAQAREIRIVFQDGSYTLQAPGADVSEASLANAFGGEGEDDAGAADIALGLRSGIRCGFQRARLEQQRVGKPGFRWSIATDSEESEELVPAAESGLFIELATEQNFLSRARHFFQGAKKAQACAEEASLLSELYGCWRVPLWMNGSEVARVLPSWSGRLSAAAGEIDVGVSLRVPAFESWEGTVAIERGSIKVYRNGVLFSEISHCGMSGAIWHRGLSLDLSREGLVQDAHYEQFMKELFFLRRSLLQWYSSQLAGESQENIALYLSELVLFCLEDDDPAVLKHVHTWLQTTYTQDQLRSLQARETNVRLEVLRLYMELPKAAHFQVENWEPEAVVLLYLCAQALQERYPGTDQLLREATELIGRNYPDDSLALGYTLLGLGACLSILGQIAPAESAWARALDVAEKSGNPKHVALMRTHLKHPTYHMAAEVAKALRMYVSSKSGLR